MMNFKFRPRLRAADRSGGVTETWFAWSSVTHTAICIKTLSGRIRRFIKKDFFKWGRQITTFDRGSGKQSYDKSQDKSQGIVPLNRFNYTEKSYTTYRKLTRNEFQPYVGLELFISVYNPNTICDTPPPPRGGEGCEYSRYINRWWVHTITLLETHSYNRTITHTPLTHH